MSFPLRNGLIAGEAAFFLVVAWISLSLLPVRLVIRVVGLHGNQVQTPDPFRMRSTVPESVATVAWAVRRAARSLPLRVRCLHEALAGTLMLRRRHLPAMLMLGVRRSDDGVLIAHAWVMSDGIDVLGSTPRPFVPIVSFR